MTPLSLFGYPKVFKVPTRLNILHEGDEHIVYDPVTGYRLQATAFLDFAEEFAQGFLDCMKGYAEEGCLSTERWVDDSKQYLAYLLGLQTAQDICEAHLRTGGTFETEDDT